MFENIRNQLAKTFKEHRIGELLVKKGLLTEQQLREALEESLETGEKIGRVLISRGYISSFQLYHRILRQWQLRFGTIAIVLLMQIAAPVAIYSDNSFLGDEFKLSYNMTDKDHTSVNYPKLFGYKEFKSNDVSAFKKWTSTINKYDEQMNLSSMTSARVMVWKDVLDNLKHNSTIDQVAGVNDFINKFQYINDSDNYEQSDYWATPLEFISKGGDCEDFAIAKYASLKALGFSPSQMRIAVVRDTIKDIPHAVLIVYVEGKSFVLDNQDKQVEETASVTRYKPIFSINSSGWWLHEA